MDNLQIKTEKLIAYGKQQLQGKGVESSAITIREMLDDIEKISAGGGATWDDSGLNPDLQWAKDVYDNTPLGDYVYKTLELTYAVDKVTKFNVGSSSKVITSDGQVYEKLGTTVEHIWNDEKARNAEYYKGEKLRYFIRMSSGYVDLLDQTSPYTIYFVSNSRVLCHKNSKVWNTIKTFDFDGDGGLQPNQFPTTFEYPECIERIPSFKKRYDLNQDRIMALDGCHSLKYVEIGYDTSQITDFGSMFRRCSSLREHPYWNTESATKFTNMFYECYSLLKYDTLNSKNVTDFYQMFYKCYSLKEVDMGNTSNGQNFNGTFYYCGQLETVRNLNLINATNVTNIVNSCAKLKNLDISNIKISLTIGSGTSYGHLLTLESLTNAIQELWDNTNGTSTLTLTVGSANLQKLANVYVKLIDITDEMRAEDEYIDNKKPFVVCESTDEGAMLITEYVTSKNWQLA